ncbi:FAD-binding oxidoreductase [Pseudonocardia sp. Cha107L01]|uniref:FAD-binding oxidoreductase n=1 Tax=Pseudonocardia sp. Cha107L01 TaxID=3457576 RepID=UPI00403E612A
MTTDNIVTQAHQLSVRTIDRVGLDACSITLEVPTGAVDDFRYRPGQFITLRLWIDDAWHARCYSVCDWDQGPGLLRIGVKQIPDGIVSGWINNTLMPGDLVWCLPPSGIFTPTNLEVPLVLVAGGSGITPILAIAKAALAEGSPDVALCYANRSQEHVMFREEIDELARCFPQQFHVRWWMDDVDGLMSPEAVKGMTSGSSHSTEFLICGPTPFMALVTDAIADAGIDRHRIHIEKFNSLEGDPFVVVSRDESTTGEQAEISVTLYGESHTVPWDTSQNLLVALETAGLGPIPFSYGFG